MVFSSLDFKLLNKCPFEKISWIDLDPDHKPPRIFNSMKALTKYLACLCLKKYVVRLTPLQAKNNKLFT